MDAADQYEQLLKDLCTSARLSMVDSNTLLGAGSLTVDGINLRMSLLTAYGALQIVIDLGELTDDTFMREEQYHDLLANNYLNNDRGLPTFSVSPDECYFLTLTYPLSAFEHDMDLHSLVFHEIPAAHLKIRKIFQPDTDEVASPANLTFEKFFA
jgi:hypothetical protein